MAELTDYQRDILIRTVLGEARGEGADGMAAVAHVIRNRAGSGTFPSDPAQVALQNNQFSVWNEGAGGGKTDFSPGSDLYQRAARVVDGVFSGSSADPTNGAIYYHTPSVSPSWSGAVNKHGTTQIGNHIFYNGKPGQTALAAINQAAPVPQDRPAGLGYAPQDMSLSSVASLPRKGQTRAADLSAMERNAVTPFLTKDGNGVTSPSDLVFWDGKFGAGQDGASDEASRLMAGSQPKPLKPVPQSIIERNPPKQSSAPKPANPSIITTTFRNLPQVDPALQAAVNRQAQTASVAMPKPRPNTTQTIASLPTTKPPTTRVVQSVQVPTNSVFSTAPARQPPVVAPYTSPLTASDRTRTAQVAPKPNKPTVKPPTTVAQVSSPYGYMFASGRPPALPTVAQPAGSINNNKGEERLLAGQANPPANYGGVNYQLAGLPGTPQPRPANKPVTQVAQAPGKIAPRPFDRPTAVGTQIDVKPMPPLPRPRPNFGMGGPDTLPQLPGPIPRQPYAPMAGRNLRDGFIASIIGSGGPSLLGQLMGLNASRPPVGASLGRAGNGGQMMQGANGVINSLSNPALYGNMVNANLNKAGTPMYSLDRIHSGQDERYTSNGDGSFQSESGGVYYDRHINR